MKKILYVVSTLKRSGPTNQLYNLVKHLDRNLFDLHLITLSPEPEDSRWKDFEDLGVNLYSLNLSRFQGLLFAKKNIVRIVNQIQPTLIHSQGIRADSLVCKIIPPERHIITAHNFAPEDYISKFGSIKGRLMVYQHFKIMRRSKNLISCSRSINKKLNSVGIKSTPIQNGVDINLIDSGKNHPMSLLPKPIFISVGSLIPRKNMEFLIKEFNAVNKGSLVILGDGPLMQDLKNQAGKNIHLYGNVTNVPDYLLAADYFVSASLSEGLPNTVLEALAAGVPAILSNIESHVEIFNESQQASCLFELSDGGVSLKKIFSNPEKSFSENSRLRAKEVANDVFSAKKMSQQYQRYYLEIADLQ